MTVKHNNNILNLTTGCLYVSSFGLHVSVNFMTIIRSIRVKIYDIQPCCMSYILTLIIVVFDGHINKINIMFRFLLFLIKCLVLPACHLVHLFEILASLFFKSSRSCFISSSSSLPFYRSFNNGF